MVSFELPGRNFDIIELKKFAQWNSNKNEIGKEQKRQNLLSELIILF